VSFPSWKDVTGAFTKFQVWVLDEQKKITKDIQDVKERNPLIDKIVKSAIPFFPPPFNGIAQLIYDAFDGSNEDKLGAVQHYFEFLQSQGEHHYNEITKQLEQIHSEIKILAKEESLQLIKDMLVSSKYSVDLLTQYLQRSQRLVHGTVFELAILIVVFLESEKLHTLDRIREDIVVLGLIDTLANDPLFSLGRIDGSLTPEQKSIIGNFRNRLRRLILRKYGAEVEKALEAGFLTVLIGKGIMHSYSPAQFRENVQQLIGCISSMKIPRDVIRYMEQAFERWLNGSCGKEEMWVCISLFDNYCRDLAQVEDRPVLQELESLISGDILPCDEGYFQKAQQLHAKVKNEFPEDLV
jgi:hypothetical protein